MERIYLDHASKAPIDPHACQAMEAAFSLVGNPSSIHADGVEAKSALEESRAAVAGFLGARTQEIAFCASGTESDNLAILGFARANADAGRHIVTTAIEHPAVLEACAQLEREDFEVARVSPDETGAVSVENVLAAIRPDTILVSVMLANSETGVIQPVSEIGNAIQKMRRDNGSAYPVLHSDACQATPWLDLNVEKLHVDLLSLNGTKAYAPSGSAILFARTSLSLEPLFYGGGQEKSLRSGTENTPATAGLAKALETCAERREADAKRIGALRDKLVDGILNVVPGARLNGSSRLLLPGHANISFEGVDAEALVLYLDAQGIAVSSGSACQGAKGGGSHVLEAMGVPRDGPIRFSLGRGTTEAQVSRALGVLPSVVTTLRKH